MSLNRKPFYECEHCCKKLLRKASFDKHVCEPMRKLALCKTKKGNAAFHDYKYWLSLKKRNVTEFSTFMNSKFFNSFIEFQEFCSVKGIPDKKLFIQYMVGLDIAPFIWKTDIIYEKYIIHYDTTKTPMEMVTTTLSTLSKLATILECDIGDVLQHLLPSEISKLIFERRLSPWLLLFSTKFMHYLHMLTDESQYIMINSVIDSDEWHRKFKAHPKTVQKIKSFITEFNL